jgi:hypothetical protein
MQNAPFFVSIADRRVQNVVPVKLGEVDGEDGIHA